MKVVVLAGGKGIRMRGVTRDRYPKCMVEVHGKPFIHWLLRKLEDFEVYVSVGHLGDQIGSYLQTCFPHAICMKEPTPLGTGGAVRFLLPAIGEEPFLVLNGDTIHPFFNYNSLSKECDTILTSGSLTGNSIVSHERLISYRKGSTLGNANEQGGVYTMWRFLDTPDVFDMEEVIRASVGTKVIDVGKALEVGSPEGLEEARRYL